MFSRNNQPYTGERQEFVDRYQDRLVEVIDDIAYRVKPLNSLIDREVRLYVSTLNLEKPRTKIQKRLLEKASLKMTEAITYETSLKYINTGLVKFLKFFSYIMHFPSISYLTYERMRKKYPFLFRKANVLIPESRLRHHRKHVF